MATSCSVGMCCASWTNPLDPLRSAAHISTACLRTALENHISKQLRLLTHGVNSACKPLVRMQRVAASQGLHAGR